MKNHRRIFSRASLLLRPKGKEPVWHTVELWLDADELISNFAAKAARNRNGRTVLGRGAVVIKAIQNKGAA